MTEDQAGLLRLASGRPAAPPAAEACGGLVRAAVREGLAGIFFAEARSAAWRGRLPVDASLSLQSIYHLTVQTNLRYLALLREIASCGVPFVVMQGAALLLTAYADPGLRPLSDIDLWVRPRDRERLASALRRLRFVEAPCVPGVFRRGTALVDVHTHLHWAERIRSSRFLFADEADRAFDRAVLHDCDGTALRGLEPYDEAIYLVVHALKHNLERLVWLADLNRLTAAWGDAEWGRMMDRARALGQERACAVYAYARRALFGLDAPDLPLDPLSTHLVRRRRRGPLPKWSSLALLSAGGWTRRARFAFESTFPRRDVLQQVIRGSEDMSGLRLYGLRMKQMVGMMHSP